MKYIPTDKLIAEIERRMTENCELAEKADEAFGQRAVEDNDILAFIDSLQQEQPEVDLEKELVQWRHKHFKGKRDDDYNGEYLERESQLDLASYFYSLGLNARKV